MGGGLGSNGSNPFAPVSLGSTTTILDSTISHNQAIGGSDGAGQGGGIANHLGGVVHISGSTLTHNRALGGDGGTVRDGGDGFGGAIYNGEASTHPSNPGTATVLIVARSAITKNKAQGGSTGAGGVSAGDGWGGGLWSGGATFILDSHFSHNHALGGDGSNGGDGYGGGVFNSAVSSLRFERSAVTKNHANGGEGVGGGVYNLGDFDFDVLETIFANHASTDHDDIFDVFGSVEAEKTLKLRKK